MLKKYKILLIIFILFLVLLGFMQSVLATENETGTDINEVAKVSSVTPLSNLPEATLGLNNILNVILIAIGILLILFAIAILIRLKSDK